MSIHNKIGLAVVTGLAVVIAGISAMNYYDEQSAINDRPTLSVAEEAKRGMLIASVPVKDMDRALKELKSKFPECRNSFDRQSIVIARINFERLESDLNTSPPIFNLAQLNELIRYAGAEGISNGLAADIVHTDDCQHRANADVKKEAIIVQTTAKEMLDDEAYKGAPPKRIASPEERRKADEILVQAYEDYIFLKAADEISHVDSLDAEEQQELSNAQADVKSIETSEKSRDPSINKNDVWQRANTLIEPKIEDYRKDKASGFFGSLSGAFSEGGTASRLRATAVQEQADTKQGSLAIQRVKKDF